MAFVEQDSDSSNGQEALHIKGIRFTEEVEAVRTAFLAKLEELELQSFVDTTGNGDAITFSLQEDKVRGWMPGFDTTHLSQDFGLDIQGKVRDFERETVLAMLAAPRLFEYPNYEEFAAALRIRRNIAYAANKTELAFHTTAAERPWDFWAYDEDRGFTILPGKSLITALQKATQPEVSGKLYSFSCYRATEYVILLGIAQELASINPPLFQRLQSRWENKAIMSGRFHETFLYEYGSMEDPLPLSYYVPGDRVWFRNPDPYSSDVSGYEGSWVIYLGGGLFSNFWDRAGHFTLKTKCIEIYHWRHGVFTDEAGELQMDESIVAGRKRETLANEAETQRILGLMMRARDPSGTYADGGCIDTTREFARRVCPGTEDIPFPPL